MGTKLLLLLIFTGVSTGLAKAESPQHRLELKGLTTLATEAEVRAALPPLTCKARDPLTTCASRVPLKGEFATFAGQRVLSIGAAFVGGKVESLVLVFQPGGSPLVVQEALALKYGPASQEGFSGAGYQWRQAEQRLTLRVDQAAPTLHLLNEELFQARIERRKLELQRSGKAIRDDL